MITKPVPVHPLTPLEDLTDFIAAATKLSDALVVLVDEVESVAVLQWLGDLNEELVSAGLIAKGELQRRQESAERLVR